jgi:hypothetical protein
VFDVLGLDLPIGLNDRQVYFEPGASAGSSPADLFRHRDGPRQTILNRIQTGLSGGPRRPSLFSVSSQTLPATVSLVDNWIPNLRAVEAHRQILDDRLASLLTWLFRYGVPSAGGKPAPIAEHIQSGTLRANPNVELTTPPVNLVEMRTVVQTFFSLKRDEVQRLFPRLA